MEDLSKEDVEIAASLIDEARLREKYQEALDSGCTPEFAEKYVGEVVLTMMRSEAESIGLRPGVLSALIANSKAAE